MLLDAKKNEVEKAILDFVGVLGWAKATPVFVESKKHNKLLLSISRKELTNIRAAGSDDAIQLTPPREMTLEFALEFIADDELVEVTPKNIRLRKLNLKEIERKRAAKRPTA